MASTAPGSAPDLVRDAHYHAVAATASWSAFMDAMRLVATNDPDERAETDARRKRATDYARGILGRH